jgi:hypothetical protein
MKVHSFAITFIAKAMMASIPLFHISNLFAATPAASSSISFNLLSPDYRLNISSDEGDEISVKVFDRNGQERQSIPVKTEEKAEVDLKDLVQQIDVDQDGYIDLVFLVDRGREPFFNTKVYRYNKDSSLFVEDTKFPDESEPIPTSKKGCIYSQVRHAGGYGDYYYEITKWCEVNDKDVGWKLISSCDDHTKKSCPDCDKNLTASCNQKREKEIEKWQKKYRQERQQCRAARTGDRSACWI